MKADAVQFIRWFESVTSADVSIVGGIIAARARVAEAERMSTAIPVEHLAEAYP